VAIRLREIAWKPPHDELCKVSRPIEEALKLNTPHMVGCYSQRIDIAPTIV
jgi:hypothetical protein